MNKTDMYIDWGSTPKKWHYFMCVASIFAALMNLSAVASDYNTFAAYPETKELLLELGIYWPIIIISLGSAVVSALMIAAFVGLLKRRWFGPKTLVAAYIVSVVRNIVYEVVILSYPSIFGGMGSEVAGYAIGSAVFAIGNWIYYSKRRALFLPLSSSVK